MKPSLDFMYHTICLLLFKIKRNKVGYKMYEFWKFQKLKSRFKKYSVTNIMPYLHKKFGFLSRKNLWPKATFGANFLLCFPILWRPQFHPKSPFKHHSITGLFNYPYMVYISAIIWSGAFIIMNNGRLELRQVFACNKVVSIPSIHVRDSNNPF